MRTGIGIDAHRFDPARPLILGGVEIPDSPGLAGHSDADVLCHAVADAVLGAAALGDLGDHFPADERWRDASSVDLLTAAVHKAENAGYRVVGVDASVIAERPRLAPHRRRMATGVASAMGLDATLVSVKATTTDGLGFTGRGEGIACMAVVTLVQARATL